MSTKEECIIDIYDDILKLSDEKTANIVYQTIKLDILIKERIRASHELQINQDNDEYDSDGNIDYDGIGLQSVRSCHFKESRIPNVTDNIKDTNANY
jgi:hypothetical protein